jgi:hypothetical protein
MSERPLQCPRAARAAYAQQGGIVLKALGVLLLAFLAYLGPYAWYSNKVTREAIEQFCADQKPGAALDAKAIETRAAARGYQFLSRPAEKAGSLVREAEVSVHARSSNGRWWCAIEHRDGRILSVKVRGRTMAD